MPVAFRMLLRDIASGEGRVISLPAQREQCIGFEAHLFGDGLRLLVSGALDVKAALPGKRRDRLPSAATRCDALPCLRARARAIALMASSRPQTMSTVHRGLP